MILLSLLLSAAEVDALKPGTLAHTIGTKLFESVQGVRGLVASQNLVAENNAQRNDSKSPWSRAPEAITGNAERLNTTDVDNLETSLQKIRQSFEAVNVVIRAMLAERRGAQQVDYVAIRNELRALQAQAPEPADEIVSPPTTPRPDAAALEAARLQVEVRGRSISKIQGVARGRSARREAAVLAEQKQQELEQEFKALEARREALAKIQARSASRGRPAARPAAAPVAVDADAARLAAEAQEAARLAEIAAKGEADREAEALRVQQAAAAARLDAERQAKTEALNKINEQLATATARVTQEQENVQQAVVLQNQARAAALAKHRDIKTENALQKKIQEQEAKGEELSLVKKTYKEEVLKLDKAQKALETAQGIVQTLTVEKQALEAQL